MKMCAADFSFLAFLRMSRLRLRLNSSRILFYEFPRTHTHAILSDCSAILHSFRLSSFLRYYIIMSAPKRDSPLPSWSPIEVFRALHRPQPEFESHLEDMSLAARSRVQHEMQLHTWWAYQLTGWHCWDFLHPDTAFWMRLQGDSNHKSVVWTNLVFLHRHLRLSEKPLLRALCSIAERMSNAEVPVTKDIGSGSDSEDESDEEDYHHPVQLCTQRSADQLLVKEITMPTLLRTVEGVLRLLSVQLDDARPFGVRFNTAGYEAATLHWTGAVQHAIYVSCKPAWSEAGTVLLNTLRAAFIPTRSPGSDLSHLIEQAPTMVAFRANKAKADKAATKPEVPVPDAAAAAAQSVYSCRRTRRADWGKKSDSAYMTARLWANEQAGKSEAMWNGMVTQIRDGLTASAAAPQQRKLTMAEVESKRRATDIASVHYRHVQERLQGAEKHIYGPLRQNERRLLLQDHARHGLVWEPRVLGIHKQLSEVAQYGSSSQQQALFAVSAPAASCSASALWRPRENVGKETMTFRLDDAEAPEAPQAAASSYAGLSARDMLMIIQDKIKQAAAASASHSVRGKKRKATRDEADNDQDDEYEEAHQDEVDMIKERRVNGLMDQDPSLTYWRAYDRVTRLYD